MPSNKKQRIVFCALDAYARVGGMQRFNRRVIDTLRERRIGKTEERGAVYILGDGPDNIPSLEWKITVKGFKGRRSAFFLRSIEFASRANGILILGHINLLPIAVLAKLIKPNVKTILFAHGVEVWDSEVFRRKRFYEPWMLRNYIDRVVAVSQYTATVMCDRFRFSETRISILPNAVDLVDGDVANKHSDRPTLLAVTRLSMGDVQKNVDNIIRAVAALKSRWPTLTLEIIGDGELRNNLEGLAAKLNVSEQVRFLGTVSDVELAAAYRRASIFVLPSAKEGFGIVYLEAWQHSLAVIAACSGATPEIVEDGVDGLLIDLDSPTALADAIERLLGDDVLARQLGTAGRRKIERMYLGKHFSRNLNRIIEEVVNHGEESDK